LEFDDENVEIRANKSTKEIVTRYQVEEGQNSEMTIRLPLNYPLAEVEIIGTSRVGVNPERWNKWLLTCKIACKVHFYSHFVG
jgi:E3 ubiquitin-protein ligase listerin